VCTSQFLSLNFILLLDWKRSLPPAGADSGYARTAAGKVREAVRCRFISGEPPPAPLCVLIGVMHIWAPTSFSPVVRLLMAGVHIQVKQD
jgi:hypothetical protein